MMKYPLKNFVLVAAVAIFIFTANVFPAITNPLADYQLLGEGPRSCKAELDALDTFFNARRQARQQTATRPQNLKTKLDIFEPEAVCLMEERFGGNNGGGVPVRHDAFGDGPKFTCGVDLLAKRAGSGKNCLVYNVGSNNVISFEVAVQTFIGCEIHTFDPTLNRPYIGANYSHFHPWGIGLDGEKAKLGQKAWIGKGIEAIYKELGHKEQKRKIDILKIDCEGCEWKTMPLVFEAMARGDLRIDQIQIELHVHKTPVSFDELQAFFDGADKAGLRIAHKERNHWGCEGYRCLEYVFVHEDFLRDVNAAAMGCSASTSTFDALRL